MNGGFYGNTNNEYTPMFDMQCMLSITINGQLLLLMLCEQLAKIGVKIDMCNTDGITILYDDRLHDQVEAICDNWQKVSKMELETVDYSKVVRMNINNYLAFYEDKDKKGIKQKGLFLTFEDDPDPMMNLDMSRDFVVIAKALKAYYEHSTPIEQFIRSHKNVYDFCTCQKVDKKYKVFWNGKEQQRLNRYYINKKGAYLYKSKDGQNMEHMMKDFSVEIFNDYFESDDYKINYEFYISETKKLLNELEPNQMALF